MYCSYPPQRRMMNSTSKISPSEDWKLVKVNNGGNMESFQPATRLMA